jgi:hypothetical protein
MVRHRDTHSLGIVICHKYTNPLLGWRYYDVLFIGGSQIIPMIDLELISPMVQDDQKE